MPQPWKSQPWVEAYDLALLEFDLTKLPSRIEAAKSVIELRVAHLSDQINLTGRLPEMESLIRALQVLRLIAEHGPLRKPEICLNAMKSEVRCFRPPNGGDEMDSTLA